MVNTSEILACIARKHTTQEAVAKACGISSKTFYNKMKKGVFGTNEVEKMIDFLDIKNPADIFFAKEVTR